MENKTFTTSKGIVLPLLPVSQFKLDSLLASKTEVTVPTYQVETVAGEKQTLPLDEVVAKNKDKLEEWNDFLARKNKAETEYAEKFLELLVWDGVEIEVPGPDSEWQANSDYFGIKVPENQIKRKLFYLYNELLGPPEDIGDLISEIFAVSKVDEVAVKKLRETFRSALHGKAHSGLPKTKVKVENK